MIQFHYFYRVKSYLHLMHEPKRHLFLIPSTLGDAAITRVIPAYNFEVIQALNHFVVEAEKTARRFLIRCGYKKDLNMVQFYTLSEHTQASDIPSIFTDSYPADLGMISEAGMPGVADPGALLVEEASRLKLQVVPLSGPSSLLLALMASGLNGQQFAFNGYLPVKAPERNARIRFLEKRSAVENQSQLFIEAPYRNNPLTEAFLVNCKPTTRLCIAVNLTLPDEWIRTFTIQEWRKMQIPDLKNRPAVFILQA